MRLLLLAAAALCAVRPLLCPAADPDAALRAVANGFEARRDAAFQLCKHRPLVRGKVVPPISASRVPFYRSLSDSLVGFAARCFWLEDQLPAANAALMENCAIYLDRVDVMRDRDSFYWSADILCRIVEYWGAKGSRKPGLLAPATEAAIRRMMWQWLKDQSRLKKPGRLCSYLYATAADFAANNTWDVEESENHHLQRVATRWQFAKILDADPSYRNRPCDDGFTVARHYAGWNAYAKQYLRERARKGLFVEFANDGYGRESLKGVYNFCDFGDPEQRGLARKFLDLFWAAHAQESLDGVSGGAKARVYPGAHSLAGDSCFRHLLWYYALVGGSGRNDVNEIFSFLSSGYRPPLVVLDLLRDAAGRGAYVVEQRRLGLAKDGYHSNLPFYRLDQTKGLVRYSYCTPDFIMGSFFCEALPADRWTAISCQNRWAGVIFSSHRDARIIAQCETTDARVYNAYWCVQARGTMIVQRLGRHVKGPAGNMGVWISANGLAHAERDGWIFVAASNRAAYAAIRFVGGHKPPEPQGGGLAGTWYHEAAANTPVIIVADQARRYAGFADFRQKVLATRPVAAADGGLVYRSIMGDTLALPAGYKGLPFVNGKPVDLAPAAVMRSPFVSSAFNSGIYTICKGARKLVLDFNPGAAAEQPAPAARTPRARNRPGTD